MVMREEQLRSWLRSPTGRPASDCDVRELLGDLAARIPDIARRSLGFAIAMLRDIYGSDEEIRDWLGRPARELGAKPIDLLRAGNVRDVESLLVRHWNHRSRASSHGRQLMFRSRVGAR
jgi:antitoxin Xre/MbcA/ParS-like protein